MAVYLPIISEFNPKGINKAKREFQSLSGVGQKTGFLLKKAFLPATAAVAALAAASMKAVDAALEDQKSQMELARVMKATMSATQGQINLTEDWITKQGKLYGITDDDLRPSLAKLFRVTKDVGKAFLIATLGMNIARATSKDLGSVTDALTKALGGNMKPLKALAPELAGLIKQGASVDEVFGKLNETFGGAAAAYADTAAGRMEILKLRFSELFEQLGYAILPAFEKLMPYFEKLATWLENNPDKVAKVAENFAILAQWAADFAGVILGIPDAFGAMVNYVIDQLEKLVNAGISLVNVLIDQFNRIPFVNLPKLSNVDFNPKAVEPMNSPFSLMAQSQRLAAAQRAARTPLPPGIQGPVVPSSGPQVTVNVNGGDPRAVVDAITRWARQNGPLPPAVRVAG